MLPPSNALLQKSKKSSPFVVHFDKLKVFYGTPPTDWRSTTTSTVDVPSQHRDPGDVTPTGHPSSIEIQLTNDVQSVPAPVEDQPAASDIQLPTQRLRRHRRPPKHLDAYCRAVKPSAQTQSSSAVQDPPTQAPTDTSAQPKEVATA